MYPEKKGRTFRHVGTEGLDSVAGELIEAAGDYRIWCFEGEMGAGKTTLIRQVCARLGVVDVVHSPTFGIVNEYMLNSGGTVFHFDFYRIRHLAEAIDIGIDDYFYSGAYCLIEWPEKIASLLPEQRVTVHLEMDDEQHRNIAFYLS